MVIPHWKPGNVLKAADLVGLEDYLLSRFEFPAAPSEGLEAFDWSTGLEVEGKDVHVRNLRAVTASGHPVVVRDEPLCGALPQDCDSEVLDFDVFAVVNSESEGHKLALEVTKAGDRPSGAESEPRDQLFLGGYSWTESTKDHRLLRRPATRSLAALRPLDAEWDEWTRPVRFALDSLRFSAASYPGSHVDHVAGFDSVVERLCAEWPSLCLPELARRLLLCGWLRGGRSQSPVDVSPESLLDPSLLGDPAYADRIPEFLAFLSVAPPRRPFRTVIENVSRPVELRLPLDDFSDWLRHVRWERFWHHHLDPQRRSRRSDQRRAVLDSLEREDGGERVRKYTQAWIEDPRQFAAPAEASNDDTASRQAIRILESAEGGSILSRNKEVSGGSPRSEWFIPFVWGPGESSEPRGEQASLADLSILVTGPAGSGKSSLVRAFVEAQDAFRLEPVSVDLRIRPHFPETPPHSTSGVQALERIASAGTATFVLANGRRRSINLLLQEHRLGEDGNGLPEYDHLIVALDGSTLLDDRRRQSAVKDLSDLFRRTGPEQPVFVALTKSDEYVPPSLGYRVASGEKEIKTLRERGPREMLKSQTQGRRKWESFATVLDLAWEIVGKASARGFLNVYAVASSPRASGFRQPLRRGHFHLFADLLQYAARERGVFAQSRRTDSETISLNGQGLWFPGRTYL